MSVLIEGMEMPKNCDECPCYYETEGAWRNECQVLREECAISEGRPSWCPLVEIPPHGRLIDADALEDRCSRQATDEWNKSTGTNWGYAYATFESDVEDAPTVIEAEEGE